MLEGINPLLLQHVKQTIREKYWYTPADGKAFCWQASTNALAEELGIGDPDRVRYAIESAFTPKALTSTSDEALITALHRLSTDHDAHLTVWTVGDPLWQKNKATRTGLLDLIGDGHFYCAEQDKIADVRILAHNYPGVLVVDDKSSNLARVHNLGLSIPVWDYHLKVEDMRANPQALLGWLEQQLHNGIISDGSRWFIDMDGVLINTNGVLFGSAAENIVQLL